MGEAALVDENVALKYVIQIADTLQATDGAVRIVISLLLGYPLAFLYRRCFLGKAPKMQHLFFTVCGLWLCYFNFGWHTIHSVINILLIHLLLMTAGGTVTSVVLAFVINMGYLCLGYYWTMSENYLIKWTTPHCVLCLRLIGLVLDVFDGQLQEEKLSAEQKESFLRSRPSLLETCGYTYFFGGFLVGPQFSMKRYLSFVNGHFLTDDRSPPDSIKAGLQKLLLGLLCISTYQVLNQFFPDAMFLSEQLLTSSFWSICLFVVIWSKVMLYKYVGCWLITEGACILTGLTHNGKNEAGDVKWDGCANVDLWNYETASTCQQLVNSFNINTNKWMGKYVFKRLKFLGNKDISQIATLGFLALWHGLYSGYFTNFFLEFFLIKFEREASSLPITARVVDVMNRLPGGWLLLWIVKKVHVQFILGYALIGFCLFTYPRYMPVYHSMYYVVHILYILIWPFLFNLLVRRQGVQKSKSS